MAQHIVNFQNRTRNGEYAMSYGRNGPLLTTGISIYKYEPSGDIEIEPVTSKGSPSHSCFIQIPREDIPALIEHLKKIHGGPF